MELMTMEPTNINRVAFSAAVIACALIHSTQLHAAQQGNGTDSPTVIYVAPNGHDTGEGSEAAPLATVAAEIQSQGHTLCHDPLQAKLYVHDLYLVRTYSWHRRSFLRRRLVQTEAVRRAALSK